jgi:tRNA(fMet)-specific endonuclease VapC
VVAELYEAAYRSAAREKWLQRIEEGVLPAMTVLGFDLACAQEFGRLQAQLKDDGTPIGDVDTLIAATALRHGLTVVTADDRHFQRVPGLRIRTFTPGGGR